MVVSFLGSPTSTSTLLFFNFMNYLHINYERFLHIYMDFSFFFKATLVRFTKQVTGDLKENILEVYGNVLN